MERIASPDHAKNNPCSKEQALTYKCFNDNNYDKGKCVGAMQNYRRCKDFWGYVRTQRRRKGIFPLLPEESEREKVKEEYLQSFADVNK